MGHCLDQRSACCWGDWLHFSAAVAETRFMHWVREIQGLPAVRMLAASVELSAPPELRLRCWGAAGAHVRTGQPRASLHVDIA